MDELLEEYPRLPKNIRQIGEREEAAKVYVEDYVNTYLRRLYPDPGRLLRTGILLGNLEVRDGIPFIFVDGALEMEEAVIEGEKVLIADEVWKKSYDEMGRLFPKSEILGWFLCAAPGANLSPLTYWNQHGEYFPGKYKLMYLNHTTDQDEAFFMTSIEGLYRLGGYCIYYERNQCMQDYMVLRKDARRIEVGVDDSVTRNFKVILQEKKGQVHRKKSMHFMYGVSSFLLMLVIAGAVTMMNNYDKMKSMEVAIANLSDNVVGVKTPVQETKAAEPGTGITIEHIQGGVSMTEPEGQETAAVNATAPGETSAAGESTPQQESSTASLDSTAASQEGTAPTGAEVASSAAEVPTGAATEGSKAAPESQSAAEPDSGSTTKEEMASIETREDMAPAVDMEAAAAAGKLHIVKEGETLYSICLEKYESISKVEEICQLNQLDNPDVIMVGQKLVLP